MANMDSHAELTANCGDLVTMDDEETIAKRIEEAGKRAAAEAEERRKLAEGKALPPELGGRDGPEPVRYGDWEKKGLAVDF